MINNKENSINTIESTLFLVLFFLFVCVVSGNSENSRHSGSSYKFASELQSNSTAVFDIQVVPFLKSLLPVIHKLNPKQFDQTLHLIAGNYTFHQQISYLLKKQLLIKPIVIQRFSACYHFIDTSDLPLFG